MQWKKIRKVKVMNLKSLLIIFISMSLSLSEEVVEVNKEKLPDAVLKDLRFPAHNSVNFCWLCNCTQGGPQPDATTLNFRNCCFYPPGNPSRAAWLDTCYELNTAPPVPDTCPLKNLDGFSRFSVLPDVMHSKHLGSDSYVGASVLEELLEETPGITPQDKLQALELLRN